MKPRHILLIAILGLVSISAWARPTQLQATQVPPTLKSILTSCEAIDSRGLLKCPIVRAFRYNGDGKDLTDVKVLSDLLDRASQILKLRRVSVAQGSSLILKRVVEQVSFLEDSENEISQQEIDAAHLFSARLEGYVRGWQQLLFADADSYWAPSVNASALVLVNPEIRSVIVITHGDIDG